MSAQCEQVLFMKVSEPYTIFPRTLKSGKTVYYYQYRLPDGTRSSAKSTGCTTEASAKRFCNKLYNAGDFQKTSSTKFSCYTKDFFTKDNEWFKWKEINNRDITDETILAYNKVLRNQLMPFFENYQLQAITRNTVKQWIIWASERWSPKTVNNGQTVLNTILNSAVDKEIIKFNPALNIGFRTTNKIVRNVFTAEELHKMYHQGSWGYESLRTAFLLCCITGMRIGEVCGLRQQDIFEDYLIVSHTYSRNFGLGKTTKGKISRIVPIPSNFPFLQPNKDGYVFTDSKGEKPFNCTTMYDNVIRACTDVGINSKERKLTTHVLRDFYNTYLESENISERKIKAVIGHSQKKDDMTEHYTYWKPDMFPEVHEAQNKLYKQILEGV